MFRFRCNKHSKIFPHNFIRDSWASALQPALLSPLSCQIYISQLLNQKSKPKQKRPTFSLHTLDISARPFDISFDPDLHPNNNNYCNCPFSTVGADSTITHSLLPFLITLTDDVEKTLKAIVDEHLQQSEQEKYKQKRKDVNVNTPLQQTIQGDTIMKELLYASTILLAFSIDPHGQWGPITQNFLSISSTA